MARFQKQAAIGSISNPYAGEAAAASTLADTLQSFGKYTTELHKRHRVEEVTAEAQAVEPGIEAPEQRTSGTISGRAYNDIVMAGHQAAIKNDYAKRITELSSEYSADPIAFSKNVDAYKKGLLNTVDPSVRNNVALDFDMATIRPMQAIKNNHEKAVLAESVNSMVDAVNMMSDDAATAARSGDYDVMNHNAEQVELAAQRLDGMGEFAKADKIRADLAERMDKQIVLGQADTAIQAGEGEAFIKSFIENPPEDLTPEQVDAHAATMISMNSRFKTLEAEATSEQSIALSREISNLKIQANTGLGDPEQIHKRTEELFNTGDISESERTSILTKLLNADAKRAQDAIDFAAVGKRLEGDDSIVVDPALQDKFYAEHYAQQFEGQPPEVVEAFNVDYVDRMKRVPSALKDQLQTYAISGDPELIRKAANLIDKVDQTPGLVASVFNPERQAFVQTVLELSESLTGQEAVQLAQKLTDPNDKTRIEARTQYIKDEKLALDYRDNAQDIFDGGWFGKATNLDDISGDQVSREYGQLFEAYYKSGMSEDKAEQEAAKRVQRNWSTWNGRVMKYAPDSFYTVAGKSDYIMDQLVKDVNDNLATEEAITKDQLVLISTEETARTAAKGQPVYRIGIVRDGGFQHAELPGWMPDVDAEVKRVEAANKKLTESAVERVTSNQSELIESMESGFNAIR
jgi:hypothetical protein